MKLKIGKYTLESLTTGMYMDPRVIFREYIQNAADSIDEAIERGILKAEDNQIKISISTLNRSVVIEDNGCGVPQWQAPHVLLDIGNSKKSYTNSRGFRGIGRLAGLGHATSVSFETSYIGEDVATVIHFDAQRLQKLMIPGVADSLDLGSLVDQITNVSQKKEASDSHYFKVVLRGVQQPEIIDVDTICEYLQENAPLPYDEDSFSEARYIRDFLQQRGFELKEYKTILIDEDNGKSNVVFKPFRNQYLVDKQKKLLDELNGLDCREINSDDGKTLAIMWIGRSQLLGGIIDPSFKGIRFRKGNILIGGRSTLNGIFSEERFNGWFQGEIFVLDHRLIPNARRDDFEKTPAYMELLAELKKIGNELSKDIRVASAKRNAWRQRTRKENIQVSEDDLVLVDANNIPQGIGQVGFSALDSISSIAASSQKNLTKYSALNISQRLSLAEKKTLEKVFDTLLSELGPAQGEQMVQLLVERLQILH